MKTWREISKKSNDEIIAWAAARPWALEMADCQQDPEWHAEGDVWTHSVMVCRELERLDEWPNLNRMDQLVLLFTALLHDSAKPATSAIDPDTGHIRSPKHALKGEHLARAVLRDLECDFRTRERISRMVRFHGRPVFLMEREEPETEVIRMSWLVNNRLLHLFALADMRGRHCDMNSRDEDDLALWQVTAEDSDCYDHPYPFANEHARFLFCRSERPNRHYVPHEEYSCRVTMMSGYPGAGKDTWLAQQRPELPVVSLDEIRQELGVDPTGNQGQVQQAARERCAEHLRKSRNFAFSATNLTRLVRSKWIDLFADYGAHIEVVYIEPPLSTVLKQNRNRSRVVPEDVIRSLAKKVEPPTMTEAHNVLVVP
ncbi:MAG: AAA family ATPase [Planctomycetaceae bacterium]